MLEQHGVAVYDVQQMPRLAAKCVVVKYALHRVEDERKWCAQLMAYVGEEIESRIGQFHHFPVELFQFVVLFRELQEEPVFRPVTPVDGDCGKRNGGETQGEEPYPQGFPLVVFLVFVHLTVECRQDVHFPVGSSCGDERQLYVVGGQYGCREVVFFFHLLAVKDICGNLYHLVAARGV